MKLNMKALALSYILILSIGTILSLYIPKNEVTASEAVVIPKEAIRLRILANSDLESDQALKRLVRDEVNKNITNWVQEISSINQARDLIKSKLPEIQTIAEEVVKREGSTQSVHVEFGKVQFPTKLYGQFLYPAGEYEAILITLGEGKGANWWCVLFPPLCFLDFSNGVAVSDGFEGEKVKPGTSTAISHPAMVDATEPKVETVTKVETPEVEKTPVTAPEVKSTTVVENTPVVENKPEVEYKQEVVNTPQVEKSSEVGPVVTPQLEKEENVFEVPAQASVEEHQVAQAKTDPVYVPEQEQKVEVKFFLKELWSKLF